MIMFGQLIKVQNAFFKFIYTYLFIRQAYGMDTAIWIFFRQDLYVCLKSPSISAEYFQVSVYCPLPLPTICGENGESSHVSFFVRRPREVFAALMLLFVSCPELSERLSLEPFFFCRKNNTDISEQDCKNISRQPDVFESSCKQNCLVFMKVRAADMYVKHSKTVCHKVTFFTTNKLIRISCSSMHILNMNICTECSFLIMVKKIIILHWPVLLVLKWTVT